MKKALKECFDILFYEFDETWLINTLRQFGS